MYEVGQWDCTEVTEVLCEGLGHHVELQMNFEKTE